MRGWKRGIPLLVSGALVGGLLWRIAPSELATEFRNLPLGLLLPLSVLMVGALYLWDAVCLQFVFRFPGEPMPFSTALHARGSSYLASTINHQLGRAVLAWLFARSLRRTLLPAFGRIALLAFHDVLVLLSLGLLGSIISSDARLEGIRVFCGTGLAIIGGLVTVVVLLPESVHARFQQTKWGAWLNTWSWRRSLGLYVLRVGYFGISLAYVVIGLKACNHPLDSALVFGALPLVLMADGLPISVSGLGTRETTMILLLQPESPAMLLAFSLFWSMATLIGRAAIGLGHLWFPRLFLAPEREPSVRATQSVVLAVGLPQKEAA